MSPPAALNLLPLSSSMPFQSTYHQGADSATRFSSAHGFGRPTESPHVVRSVSVNSQNCPAVSSIKGVVKSLERLEI